MKKFVATLLACIMLVTLLAGCGNNPAPTPNNGGNTTDDKLNVVVVVTDALGGGGTPDDMNNYLKKAVADFDNVNGSIYEATDASQYEEVLRTYAREGVDLIITAFPQMVEAVTTVAGEFPNVNFAICLPLTTIDLPNVRCVEFACWELYYLAGMVAGYMTESNQVGHVLGAEQSALIANDNAYIDGLKAVNPDATVRVVNANSFSDPAAGKDVGLTLISQGCDVILTDCSNAASGVIEAGKENGVYVMADSGVHYPEAPEYVLGDTQCNYGPATYQQISDLVAGKWQGGQQYVKLKSGSNSLAISPVIRDNLPESKLDAWDAAMAAVEDAKTKIINGELVIEMNTTWNR